MRVKRKTDGTLIVVDLGRLYVPCAMVSVKIAHEPRNEGELEKLTDKAAKQFHDIAPAD